MIVTPVELSIDFLKSDLVRSPGLHASDIYGPLYAELEPNRYDYGDTPTNPLLLAMGTAWEKHFEYLLIANGVQVERPEAFISPEGIAYSPDLILFNGVARLGELKLTSMSMKDMPTIEANTFPPKFDKYMTQMMLYAYWLGFVDGWLAVLSLYKPWNPELRVFDITWTDKELAENYRMVINFAKHKGLL
jgi:hypothetical protein